MATVAHRSTVPHAWQTISEDPEHFRELRACELPHCIVTELVCTLCEADGNRRRHRAHLKARAEQGTHEHLCPVSVMVPVIPGLPRPSRT